MVSFSFTTILLVALLAVSQVVLASPSYPSPCKEVFPKNYRDIKVLKPFFDKGKTSAVIRKQWKNEDHTRVQLKHLYQNDGTLLLIKTKDAKYRHIQLTFVVNNGKDVIARYFKIQKNKTCYVTDDKNNVSGINEATYYHVEKHY